MFEPTFQKHTKAPCGGCQIHVTERETFEPVIAGAALIRECYGLAPDQFAWREGPYEYEHEKMPIDILAGSPELREQVEAQVAVTDIAESWTTGVAEFSALRLPYLLY